MLIPCYYVSASKKSKGGQDVMTKVRLGTVIHGTMREEDLVPAFLDELEMLDPERAASYRENIPEEAFEDPEHDWWSSGKALWLVEELFDVLNEYAPPFVYFGANEGDGSDYGFWVDRFSLQQAIADGEVLRVEDLSEVPADYEGLLLVENDHGNLTLYECASGNLVEIWSVV